MKNKVKRNLNWVFGLLAFTLLLAATPKVENDPLAVIVHSNNPLEELDQRSLKKIMMGHKQRWSDGHAAISLALLKTSHPIGKRMVSEIYKMRLSEYKRYWPRQIFAMKGKVPYNFTDEAELVQFVSQTTGAIGVVCECTDRSSVKTLRITN